MAWAALILIAASLATPLQMTGLPALQEWGLAAALASKSSSRGRISLHVLQDVKHLFSTAACILFYFISGITCMYV